MTVTPRKTDKYYRYGIPNIVTVQIDTREKFPLLFPEMVKVADPESALGSLPVAVQTERVKLDCGDYRLKEYPDLAVIERKASQMELFKNTCDPNDSVRQAKAFLKLANGCRFPYLLVEASPGHLFAAGDKVKNPDLIASRLSIALAKYRLRLLFIPGRSRDAAARRKMGALCAHIMLGCALAEAYDVPTIQLL